MRILFSILTFILILSCSNNNQYTYYDFKNEIKSQQNQKLENQIGTESSTNTKSKITSSNHELAKIDCTNKLEAYILAAETVTQEGIDLITKWVCVSERLFFDPNSTNWEMVNPIYITALNRHDVESAIDLEKVWCDHIKKYHNSGNGNNGYDNGKCNPKHYKPEKEGCNFGLCLFTEPNGKVAGSSISSNRKHDGFNLFISNSHDLPMHADSYGYVTIHEMFHIYQYSNLTKTRSRDDEMRMVGKLGTGSNPKDEVPWWIEGNAVFFGYYKYAKEIQDREYFINKMENAMWGKWDGILIEKYLNSEKTINEFTWTGEEKKIGYELGAWFVAFLIDQVGEEKIYEFWTNLESEKNFEITFNKYFGKNYQIYINEFDVFLRQPKDQILSVLDRIYPIN